MLVYQIIRLSFIPDPHFFRFVDPGLPLKKVYIFFTETAIEEQTHVRILKIF